MTLPPVLQGSFQRDQREPSLTEVFTGAGLGSVGAMTDGCSSSSGKMPCPRSGWIGCTVSIFGLKRTKRESGSA